MRTNAKYRERRVQRATTNMRYATSNAPHATSNTRAVCRLDLPDSRSAQCRAAQREATVHDGEVARRPRRQRHARVRLYEPHAQAVRARRQHDFICGGEYLGPSHSRSGQGTEEHTWASARSNALTHKHTLTHTPTCTHAHGHAGCSNKMRHRMQRNVPHHAISRAQRAAVCLRPDEHASCDVACNARPLPVASHAVHVASRVRCKFSWWRAYLPSHVHALGS